MDDVHYDVNKIRERPAMFIGDTSLRGYTQLTREIVDNAIEEVINGFCTEITLTLRNDATLTVEDNGRGIPLDKAPGDAETFLEKVMQSYPRGGRTRRNYAISAGLHGAGLAVVNALSKSMTVEVQRDGTHYRMQFAHGISTSGLEIIGDTDKHGTRITFTPDPDIFGSEKCFMPERLCDYLCELAYLNREATLRFKNADNGDCMTFHSPSGIRRMLECTSLFPHEIAYKRVQDGDIQVEVAFERDHWARGSVRAWANSAELDRFRPRAEIWNEQMAPAVKRYILWNIGPETAGFLSGVRYALVREAIAQGMDPAGLRGLQLPEAATCMNAIISLRLPECQVTGSTHTKLQNSKRIRCLVKNIAVEMMSQFCADHPEHAQYVLKSAINRRNKSYSELYED